LTLLRLKSASFWANSGPEITFAREGTMEVVIETQEEVMEQPVVIELSAECLSMVGGGRIAMTY
jgi:hypothetical protein